MRIDFGEAGAGEDLRGAMDDFEMELPWIAQTDPNCNPIGLYSIEVKGKLSRRRGGDNVTIGTETRNASTSQGMLTAAMFS